MTPTSLPRIRTSQGVVWVATREQVIRLALWGKSFAQERKDHRYYEIVEETIIQGFEYFYFVMEDLNGEVRAIQPFFLLRQDFVQGAGAGIQGLVKRVRKFFPKFLTMRTLMVGCAAGEGQLDDGDESRTAWIAGCLQEALRKFARLMRSPMIVWKEFPIQYRSSLQCLTRGEYTRVPSLPFTRLAIPYKDFDEYMTKVLSKSARHNLRRKFKDVAKAALIVMEVTSDITGALDEVYPLYLQVYNKSTLQFEKLTKAYFTRISQDMPDKARFFIWRQNGRAIAFNFCMVHGDELWDEIIGLDYAIAYDLHLYFLTIRDALTWAMQNGYRWYCSGGQGFEPKLHLRCQLLPVDLYVTHLLHLMNFAMRQVLPLVEPTRGNEILRKFANYGDVWGEQKP